MIERSAARILVVDDTPANIQTLTATLKAKGYQVSVATHGRQALEVVSRIRPDLILLDVVMPEMDGFEACRHLKANPDTRDIPVIFLTARTEATDIVQGFELGALDYVAKPFNSHELLARVNTHLTMDRLRLENERLLLNVLPSAVAERLKAGEEPIADSFDEVCVLFADIVGFTALSSNMPPDRLVQLLNELFTSFDALAAARGVEKIKTIGDCYMAVCGAPVASAAPTETLASIGLEMLAALAPFNQRHGIEVNLRIGLHTGPVVAGVIGRSKFIYDLWGDTVNLASRMESTGVPGRIQVTEAAQRFLAPHFEMDARGEIEAKGKGLVKTWLLGARKAG